MWLVANYHNYKPSAISQIRIDIQDQQESGRQDLASGTEGKFRYLAWRTDGEQKITNIQLLRRQSQVTLEIVRALGFQGMTGGINAGRGGDFLYLVWKY